MYTYENGDKRKVYNFLKKFHISFSLLNRDMKYWTFPKYNFPAWKQAVGSLLTGSIVAKRRWLKTTNQKVKNDMSLKWYCVFFYHIKN